MSRENLYFDIMKFAIHDGPGIRTTLFLKGCPLDCAWCHNPESISRDKELLLKEQKCVGCGECVTACPHQCHTVTHSGQSGTRPVHTIDFEQCAACGTCVNVCSYDALSIAGMAADGDEILSEMLKDKPYYETSGGGITISGGEPMMQFDFLLLFVQKAKAAGLHICLDTTGYAPWKRYEKVLHHVDLVHLDYKETDPGKHREYTGVDNQLILESLARMDAAGASIILRCPIIPGLNDREDHFRAIAELANRYSHLEEVHVLPFHPMGMNKGQCTQRAESFGLDKVGFVEQEVWEDWIKTIQAETETVVKKG